MTDLDLSKAPYLVDIAGQPAKLAELLEAGLAPEVRRLLGRLDAFERIVLTGMGASLYALHPTFLALADLGLPVWLQDTSELLGPAGGLLTPSTLVWLVSQSGSSGEVTALLERSAAARPTVLGVTNELTSPLALGADVVLELHSGSEQTVGTRSYVNTLAAQALAVAAVRSSSPPSSLLEAPEALDDYLAGFEEHVDALGTAVRGPVTFVVGRGVSLAAVQTGALIIKEAAKVAVEGMSAPQFRHGPLELVDAAVTVVVLEGAPGDAALNRQTLDDVRRFGGVGVWLAAGRTGAGPPTPALHGEARPLGEILPLQLLSVALARRHGVEPGAFRHIEKVTRTL